jgi:tetratricopeptide (TPR) repeat protein
MTGVSARALDHLGWALGTVHADTAAVEVTERARRLHPGDFWINFHLAVLLYRRFTTDVREQLPYLETALARRPQAALVWGRYGQALAALGDDAVALEACERAVELQPEFAGAYKMLGQALSYMGKTRRALEALRRADELRPNDPWTLSQIAMTLSALKEWEEADEAVREAERAADARGDASDAYVNLGAACGSVRLILRGHEYDLKALEADPDSPSALVNYSLRLCNLGRNEEGLQAAEKAIEIQPENWRAWMNKGNNLFWMGRREEAAAAARRAIEIDRRRPGPYSQLAFTLTHLNRYDEALKYMRLASGLTMIQGCGPSPGRVEMSERLVKLAPHLDEIVAGTYPWRTSGDGQACAKLCYLEGEYDASLRLFEELFRKRPKLLTSTSLDQEETPGLLRYDAVCSAVLTGKPENIDKALAWARECYAFMERYPPAALRYWLSHFLRDPDLDSVRDLPGWKELFEEARRRFEKEAS